MAVRATSSYNTRSNSYSRPSTTQKSSAAAKTSTTSRSSSSSSKTTSTPSRDTFTYSSPSAKASAAAAKTNTTPKQNTAPKTNNTPKQGITPKQNTAPKTNNTPKQGITPKQNTAPKINNTPKQGITPKQNTTPKTPIKPTTTNKPATTPQSKTPTKPASKSNTASNKLTNDEYSQLAAKAAGVAIGSNGKPAFTSYEQSMKYAEALTNLHKSGINRNSTPQEIAAASVETKLDKNGNPIISNVLQGQNYGKALKVTLKIVEDVSSGAPAKSNGEKVNINNSQSTDSTSLSMALTGSHSEIFENYLRNLEKTYGTQYVFENVFKGDKNKYDPYKRASQITGILLRGNEPYACDPEGKKAFEAALNGTRNNSSNNTYVSHKKTEVSSGIKYTTKDILNLNGSTVFVVNDGEVEKGENVTVNIDEELAEIIMTTSNEFNIDPTFIIAVMAHESRFDSEASSGLASGLVQVNDIYFPTYASENKELIESLGGDYTNIYDEAANIVAWGASYSIWVDTYGDNKNSLKALRQGYIQPDNYPDGWSPNATNNANEFMDIKNELDNMIK